MQEEQEEQGQNKRARLRTKSKGRSTTKSTNYIKNLTLSIRKRNSRRRKNLRQKV